MRTNVCGRCNSARLNACETCAKCGSTDLREEPLVHHFRCGWQDAQSSYVQRRLLVCPKCNRELTHLGVDYDKPGITLVCQACHTRSSEAAVQFICLDCSEVTRGEEIKSVEWYHYDLTDEGVNALRTGQLPCFDVGPLLAGRPRVFSSQEFRLLATVFSRSARRYERPFAVARITMNLDELRRDVGTVQADVEFRAAIEEVIGTLRITDFASTDGSNSIIMGFPETSATDVDAIFGRLRAALKSSGAKDICLETDFAEGVNIPEFLTAV